LGNLKLTKAETERNIKMIKYKSEKLIDMFSSQRNSWEELYPSEQIVIEKSWPSKDVVVSVLDIGCACGGVGLALTEHFPNLEYFGVEIHSQMAEIAMSRFDKRKIFSGSILDLPKMQFGIEKFDICLSLSAIDWNTEFLVSLKQAWGFVAESGTLIMSLRLSEGDGINDILVSYQEIDKITGERAPYVLFNSSVLLSCIKDLGAVGSIYAFGYEGKPSSTAVTPNEHVCFVVVAVKKMERNLTDKVEIVLDIPANYLPS